MTSTQIKEDNNTLIRIKTVAKSITKINVADQLDEVVDYVDQQLPYKSYTALLYQSATGNPTAYIAKNDANLTVTYVRDSAGRFTATMPTGFIPNKTTILVGSCAIETVFTGAFINTTTIALRTFVNESGVNVYYDDELNNTFFEIRIYN